MKENIDPKLVKYHCKKCKHAEAFTRKEYFFRNFEIFVMQLLAALGFLFIIAVLFVGINPFITLLVGGNYARSNAVQDLQLRDIAINASKMCADADSDCYVESIFHLTKHLQYISDSTNGDHHYDALYVLQHSGGDCKGMSNAYIALLNSVGIKAYLSCSMGDNHCVAIVPRYYGQEREPGYWLIDLTVPTALRMPPDSDPWKDRFTGVGLRPAWAIP